jgi:hypothetical protein
VVLTQIVVSRGTPHSYSSGRSRLTGEDAGWSGSGRGRCGQCVEPHIAVVGGSRIVKAFLVRVVPLMGDESGYAVLKVGRVVIVAVTQHDTVRKGDLLRDDGLRNQAMPGWQRPFHGSKRALVNGKCCAQRAGKRMSHQDKPPGQR